MKEFDVTITETLKLTVSVEASSKEEAQQMVSDQWHAGDHILDADNFVEVEFESNDGKEISAERAPDDTIEVLMVEPGQYPRVERIGSDLASLQKAVDGYPNPSITDSGMSPPPSAAMPPSTPTISEVLFIHGE